MKRSGFDEGRMSGIPGGFGAEQSSRGLGGGVT